MTRKRLAIIATKGTLDWAYPPLILPSTAAAMDYDVQVFCTFYGLSLLRKDLSGIRISPLANPAMPMPMPMPVLVQALPWRPFRVAATQSNRSTPRAIPSSRSCGNPTPIR